MTLVLTSHLVRAGFWQGQFLDQGLYGGRMNRELSTGVLPRGRACPTPVVVGPARALLAAAEGWWTVVYTVPVERQRRVEDGVDDDGRVIRRMETRVEENLVVRGWSAQRQFLAVWASGKAECAYWWQREQEAWADLPRELVRWETPVPVPTRVSFAELRRHLKDK